MFNIVLVEPEIPQNTGNIVRTAAATGSKVHLIKPLGFDISDRALKRAGLDYWHLTDFIVYENLDEFFERNKDGRFCILPQREQGATITPILKRAIILCSARRQRDFPRSCYTTITTERYAIARRACPRL